MRSIIVWIALAVLLLSLIIPSPYGVDDGGSRGCEAVLWRVRFWHNLAWHDGVKGYETGTTVTILGIEIWNDWPRDFIPDSPGAP